MSLDPAIAAEDYEISTDLQRMDLDLVHRWLSTDAFWALARPLETVTKAAHSSPNLAAFTTAGEQVAYARVVTDHTTLAWLCDVYIDRDHRGHGLGTRLALAVVAVLRPLGLKRVMLSTADAHEVYRRAGFEAMPNPEKLMLIT